MAKITITPEELAKSAAQFRKDLLEVPVKALGPALDYFQVRTGIRYAETVGELAGNIEMGPYDEDRVDDNGVAIHGRTLRTYLGSVIKKFSPNQVASTIYGSQITKGDELKEVPVNTQVLSYLSGQLGKNLAMHLFDAKRNDAGTSTKDLFDGLDTITAREIADGNISVAKGNLYEFPEAITADNAVELIKDFCRAATDELLSYEDGSDAKGAQLNLIVPRSVLYAYRDDYKTTTGHSPIYDKYNQTVVEGFENIRLVPMAGKANSPYIQLTTRNNMLIGTDLESDMETLKVEKYHPFKLDFVATMFFGTDYESISPERLLVGKLMTND